MASASPSSRLDFLFPHAIFHLACAFLTFFWLGRLNSTVPEPYLDEVFHVRQAQTYWAGRWSTWDPKITTPPGLYIWSYALWSPFKIVDSLIELNASMLRVSSAFANASILLATLQSLEQLLWIELNLGKAPEQASRGVKVAPQRWRLGHVALNICLFPPLFFFSGLYYTDLLSALLVLVAYWAHQYRQSYHDIKCSSRSVDKAATSASLLTATLWVCGLFALLFRQTNIFWVSVYLGGLQVVQVIKRSSRECRSSELRDVVSSSWYNGDVYDPPVNTATFEDYFMAGLSLALASPARLGNITSSIVPYVSFIFTFATFVIWNGSVVLGHKEYHSASLHLPQMLYIWPYFMFFSWPLILPQLMGSFPRWRFVSGILRCGDFSKAFPRIRVLVAVILTMFLIVRFNTIVHPFTLADNRHYVFYVFRILRRHYLVKYLAIPVYLVCGWSAVTALDSPRSDRGQTEAKASNTSGKTPEKDFPSSSRLADGSGNRVSFVIVWLISTALSLITAPLVEPRYFIIPWIIWRLHVFPAPADSHSQGKGKCSTSTTLSRLRHSAWNYDHRLYLETTWYIIVNFVTGYIFLYKGFAWPQEPGNVQRFLW